MAQRLIDVLKTLYTEFLRESYPGSEKVCRKKYL
ncbi:unnamed protein product [Protopolystoma xenopodis]|uniref:Uncharacterized protein n=1 Tax=Protopolystoma xenopodis TaxID=117903 RepID=A0A3S5A535_9PLAT|nr:unnamed protein product [Protopolystoma xenopodis]